MDICKTRAENHNRIKVLMKSFSKLIILILFPLLSLSQGWQWAAQGGILNTGGQITGQCIDAAGDIYVLGNFGYSVSTPGEWLHFGSDSIYKNGVNQLFLVKYSKNGSVEWLK